MSIASEIARLQTAKADIKAAIEDKGVTVPSDATLDDYADYVDAISGGSGGIVITDTVDAAGGTIREITAQEISGTLSITQNGTYDVTQYASAEVDVAGGGTVDWDAYVAGEWPTGAINLNTTTQITDDNSRFLAMREITSVSAPLVTTITADQAFRKCSKLETVFFPLLATATRSYCFGECTKLKRAHFPVLTSMGVDFLYGAGTNVTEDVIYVFPALTAVSNDSLRQIKNEAIIDLGPNCASLGTRALYNFDFKGVLILRSASIVTCSAANSIGAITTRADATIYIPKSLYDHLGDGSALDYKAATNWSTADGYGTITWACIEGSQYETAYADGTPIT